MEARGDARYWGWELQEMGFKVRLVPPTWVKPFAERHKNDAATNPSSGRARGHLAEHGGVAPQGIATVARLAGATDDSESQLCRSWFGKLAGCCSSRSGSWTRRCASGRKRAMKRSGYGHSGHWPHLRHGDPSFRAANGGLPAQAGFLGLARPCPPPALDRGKA